MVEEADPIAGGNERLLGEESCGFSIRNEFGLTRSFIRLQMSLCCIELLSHSYLRVNVFK